MLNLLIKNIMIVKEIWNMAVSVKDLAKWIKEEVEFLTNNEEYVGGWLQLGNGLAATILWEPGYGIEERDDVIQSKDNPDYALNAGILVYNPHDTPDGWHPLSDNEGNVVTETTAFKKSDESDDYSELAKWILKDFEGLKDVDYDKNGVIQEKGEAKEEAKEVEQKEELNKQNKVTESVGDDFYNSEYKDIISKHFDNSWDFEFLDVVANILDRVDDFMDEEEIYDAVDSALIYTEDQWTVLKHYCSPDNADFNEALDELYSDLIAIAGEIVDHYVDIREKGQDDNE